MRKTPEGKVKIEVRKVFDEHGVWYWMPGSNIYGRSGQSDFIAIINGRVLAVETKADSKSNPTPMQQQFLNSVMGAGGVALVIRGHEMSELRKWVGIMKEMAP